MPRPERVFTLRELTRLLRLTPKRASQLRRLGLLGADAGGYRFRELVSARAASTLLESGATVRQVRSALDGARRLAPDAVTPLAELRLVVQDQRIVVEQDRVRLDPRTGQALLDFAGGDLERETRESLMMGMVRPLIPPADAAEIWFARASAWDGDPERWEEAVTWRACSARRAIPTPRRSTGVATSSSTSAARGPGSRAPTSRT